MRHRGRVLDPRDLDELLRDQGPAKRPRERMPILVDRVRLEGRQHVVAGELLFEIEHMRPERSGGQGTVAYFLELAALPQIHRHRNDLEVVVFPEPGDRDRGVEPSRIREDDPFHASPTTVRTLRGA